jgi:His/Glu/Gln/Arg/opine family amino acid ABC transporter permease subunit
MRFDWSVIWRHADVLLSGLGTTVLMTVIGFVVAAIGGLGLAAMQNSRSPLLRHPAFVWVAVIRAIPLLIIIFWLYYAAASKGLLTLDEFDTGVVSLALVGSGYMAEVYRSALKAVDGGQGEAARSIGLGALPGFFLVVLPQAVRTAIPPSINVFVLLLKGATLVSIVGLRDMFYYARSTAANTFQPFELYTAAAVLIILVVIIVSALSGLAERMLAVDTRRPAALDTGRLTSAI